MNYRNRALLDLAYELDCTLRLPGVCEGGTGEPAHANWAIWGKGGGMKAHDFAFCSACRKCHMELDQGKRLTAFEREFHWTRAHAETMRQLWEGGHLAVTTHTAQFVREYEREQRKTAPRNRKSRCTRPDKVIPRRGLV